MQILQVRGLQGTMQTLTEIRTVPPEISELAAMTIEELQQLQQYAKHPADRKDYHGWHVAVSVSDALQSSAATEDRERGDSDHLEDVCEGVRATAGKDARVSQPAYRV